MVGRKSYKIIKNLNNFVLLLAKLNSFYYNYISKSKKNPFNLNHLNKFLARNQTLWTINSTFFTATPLSFLCHHWYLHLSPSPPSPPLAVCLLGCTKFRIFSKKDCRKWYVISYLCLKRSYKRIIYLKYKLKHKFCKIDLKQRSFCGWLLNQQKGKKKRREFFA